MVPDRLYTQICEADNPFNSIQYLFIAQKNHINVTIIHEKKIVQKSQKKQSL